MSDSSGREAENVGGLAGTVSRNVLASLARIVAIALVALILPAYLTHHLPVETYAAWVLILQLGAYVSYLDLGIQTGISKFVAEYVARKDEAEASRHASAGLVLMLSAGLLGGVLSGVLAWQVPRLFRTMPTGLYHDVRVSVILVGFSLSFGLVSAVYSAVFLGLQRYWIPMTIAIVNRASFAAVVVAAVALRCNLAAMGLGVATVNVVTGLLQVIAWQRRAPHIRVSIRLVDFRVFKTMARYCSMQSIWTAGMLCVAGLDITIVGHYDYVQTAYYSIATLPTSFVLLLVSSMVNPLMPASSAMSTQRTASEMGDFLIRVTRYTTLMLLLTGVSLMVCGLPILQWWVGPVYASHTLTYLRILVLANVIRNLCLPYATMVCATGRQGAATAAAISEAVVNLGSSLYLASRFGAMGVALGTLLGAFVSVALHFAISMRLTHSNLAISRWRLLVNGILRPGIVILPSLVCFSFWWYPTGTSFGLKWTTLWGLATLGLAWFGGLDRLERDKVGGFSETVVRRL